jgi:hypothetical protein
LTVSGYIIGVFKLLTIISSVLVIYGFWLPHWYLYTLTSVLSVLWFTSSDYPIGKSKDRLYTDLKCKDTNGVIRTCKSLGQIIQCQMWKDTNGGNRFWLPHWYFYPLDQCIVCSLIYSFWLPHWYFYTLDQCIVCPLIYCHITQGNIWRSCKSKDRQYTGLKCNDNNGEIRSCKSKDRQYTGLKCKDINGVIRTNFW